MLKASIRLLAVLLLFQAGVVGAGGPAHAAAPSNDDVDGAIAFSSLPYSHATNTSEATVGATDFYCGGWATVWYAFTAAESGWVEVNTLGSDYDTNLALYSGDPSALEWLQCNDGSLEGSYDRIVFQAEAGATHYVSVGTCCGTGEPGIAGPGGNLVINAQTGSPPPAPLTWVEVSPASTGFVDTRSGTVTVYGTVRCDVEGIYVVNVTVHQRFNRSIARGGGNDQGPCSPSETTWTIELDSQTGTLFGGGRATLTTDYAAQNETGWSGWSTIPEQRLQLRPRR